MPKTKCCKSAWISRGPMHVIDVHKPGMQCGSFSVFPEKLKKKISVDLEKKEKHANKGTDAFWQLHHKRKSAWRAERQKKNNLCFPKPERGFHLQNPQCVREEELPPRQRLRAAAAEEDLAGTLALAPLPCAAPEKPCLPQQSQKTKPLWEGHIRSPAFCLSAVCSCTFPTPLTRAAAAPCLSQDPTVLLIDASVSSSQQWIQSTSHASLVSSHQPLSFSF